jgi:ABC-type Fe3+ transport system substrate-binding protein
MFRRSLAASLTCALACFQTYTTYTTYTLGIVASSKQADAAKALIAFLTSPAAKQAPAAKGFEAP